MGWLSFWSLLFTLFFSLHAFHAETSYVLIVRVLTLGLLLRYHVGESLIPSVRHYMRYIDAEEKLVKHGFVHKVGDFRTRCSFLLLLTSLDSLAQRSSSPNSRRKDVRSSRLSLTTSPFTKLEPFL